MSRQRIDLTGQRFGRLTVIAFSHRPPGQGQNSRWLCRCDCGVEKPVSDQNLKKGATASCGCTRHTTQAAKVRRHGESGERATPEYVAWLSMRRRCFARSGRYLDAYVRRGIAICERWLVFENFLADMGRRPLGYSLDRIDNNGNYEPSNCRWATPKQQANNRRPRRSA